MNLDPLQPLVSVGIPTYNGAKTINKAIESVLAQDYSNIELVISDNASTDETQQICRGFERKGSRVKYLIQSENIGATLNFDHVFRASKGEYFMWLGDDDWLDQDYLSSCLKELQDNNECVLVAGLAIYYHEGEFDRSGNIISLDQAKGEERVLSYYSQVDDNGLFYGLTSRKLLQDVLPFVNTMGGDWLHVARIAFKGKILTLPTINVHRALGGTSSTLENIVFLLGLPKIQAVFPYVAIATSAFKDIAWRDPTYSQGRLCRFLLALKCQRIIRLRHASSIVGIIRKCLSLVKQYLKFVIGYPANL